MIPPVKMMSVVLQNCTGQVGSNEHVFWCTMALTVEG
jgi:hypothetical protein